MRYQISTVFVVLLFEEQRKLFKENNIFSFGAFALCKRSAHCNNVSVKLLNKFFNGSVEITQKELEKYFIIECGAVKPNPKSINKTDYARLGKRVIAKGKVKR